MRLAYNLTNQLTITGDGMDPVRVVWEDYTPGAGRITIMSRGRAWTAFWGDMGCTLREFVIDCPIETLRRDLTRCMSPGLHRNRQSDTDQLDSILRTVRQALSKHLGAELARRAA